jgi:hypothetical protein
VEEIFVGGPGFGGGLLDGDGFLSGVCDEGLSAWETVVEI